jgi:hypothetical protein
MGAIMARPPRRRKPVQQLEGAAAPASPAFALRRSTLSAGVATFNLQIMPANCAA